MDEQAKIILYRQLINMEIIAKMKNYSVIEWNEFSKLSGKEVLEYAIKYRDNALRRFCNRKRIDEVNKKDFYLQLPDIDLEGEDLSKVYLHTFMAGYAKERNNGKKIFVTTKINLKDTKCIINMATIKPIIVSKDGIDINEISADIQKCNFIGCNIFGKFQNTKARLIYKGNTLPEEYIKRIKEYKVPEESEFATDCMYIDMIERKSAKILKDVEKVKQMVDYDLSTIGKDIWKYKKVIRENDIDISYTGAFIKEIGFKSIGRENYYINLEIRAKDAYKEENFDYIEKVYSDLTKSAKRNLITLALRDRKMKYIEKHEKELTKLQKRCLGMQDKHMKEIAEKTKMTEILRKEYKDGRHMELRIDIMDVDKDVRSKIIQEIYNLNDLKFIERYLGDIDDKLKNKILQEQYEKGNDEFLYRHFNKIDNMNLRQYVIENQWHNGNIEFLYKNFEKIQGEPLRKKVLESAFKNENIKFLKKHFYELPKSMKLEAVIKFKDLAIPEEELAKLLK